MSAILSSLSPADFWRRLGRVISQGTSSPGLRRARIDTILSKPRNTQRGFFCAQQERGNKTLSEKLDQTAGVICPPDIYPVEPLALGPTSNRLPHHCQFPSRDADQTGSASPGSGGEPGTGGTIVVGPPKTSLVGAGVLWRTWWNDFGSAVLLYQCLSSALAAFELF
jgi:hypothetical protein